jgi:hypothetical protein
MAFQMGCEVMGTLPLMSLGQENGRFAMSRQMRVQTRPKVLQRVCRLCVSWPELTRRPPKEVLLGYQLNKTQTAPKAETEVFLAKVLWVGKSGKVDPRQTRGS